MNAIPRIFLAIATSLFAACGPGESDNRPQRAAASNPAEPAAEASPGRSTLRAIARLESAAPGATVNGAAVITAFNGPMVLGAAISGLQAGEYFLTVDPGCDEPAAASPAHIPFAIDETGQALFNAPLELSAPLSGAGGIVGQAVRIHAVATEADTLACGEVELLDR